MLLSNTTFISDLHLSHQEPEVVTLFLDFLEKLENTDSLYILGDLFKFWVGDDDNSEINKKIKLALHKLSKKIPIYLMPGNRDFTLGKNFAKESGCILIPDPYKINLYNKDILLTHGDILCTKDIKHRIFRAITRIPLGINIFLTLPLNFRIKLAKKIQAKSAKSKLKKSKNIMLPQEEAVQNILKKYQAQLIIHGHTHVIESSTQRISQGEWTKSHGNILIYYADGSYEFKTTSNF